MCPFEALSKAHANWQSILRYDSMMHTQVHQCLTTEESYLPRASQYIQFTEGYRFIFQLTPAIS